MMGLTGKAAGMAAIPDWNLVIYLATCMEKRLPWGIELSHNLSTQPGPLMWKEAWDVVSVLPLIHGMTLGGSFPSLGLSFLMCGMGIITVFP